MFSAYIQNRHYAFTFIIHRSIIHLPVFVLKVFSFLKQLLVIGKHSYVMIHDSCQLILTVMSKVVKKLESALNGRMSNGLPSACTRHKPH